MYQQITIVGYLGRDPEMRFTPSGQAVTSFSVATSRSYTTNAGQKVDETTWFRISVWGSQAEACNQYLKKGSPVLVVGRLRPDPQSGNPRIYTRNDGTPGASFEINAQNVRFLPGGRGDSGGYQEDMGDDAGGPEEDEIPF
ncbi:MAG TPA: single-stranded DNA-binding protein [Anaerolineaceae bacterium]|jgi:single-strand DNA-binding protein|nr:MAG: Single-stranded DNA-binding protein [Anaerolineaceae bacterium 46_22]HAF48989.1 single-stranded DNA-binding protein [Anaerolineaceae bacterium]